jgi:dihydrolipoamide dehydrogenase
MAHFDTVVVGGGAANQVARAAADAGRDVALIEPGPIGGTCLNRGCNPTKMLIQRADVANTVREADRFAVAATLEGTDQAATVADVFGTLDPIAERIEQGYRDRDDVTLYKHEARFVDERTLDVDGETVTGETVVVGAGSRPVVPAAIDGLRESSYLTSAEAIRLEETPDELVVLGGGYIAAELGYYFDGMGSDVAVLEMMDTLLPREDPDVAEEFTDAARERHDVYTGYRATAVEESADGRVTVHAEDDDGGTVALEGDALLVALGRRPNTDGLDVEAGGIETDDRGFVATDDRLRTSAEGVWALGDIAGNHMFKHSADYEVEVVADNLLSDAGRTVDYTGMTHAVFTDPQVAGVGQTEPDLEEAGREYVVGRTTFPGSSMGRAMKLDRGIAKVLADAETGETLGFHLCGHEASVLVHEGTLAVRNGLSVRDVAETIHVHPSLSKVVSSAFADAANALES